MITSTSPLKIALSIFALTLFSHTTGFAQQQPFHSIHQQHQLQHPQNLDTDAEWDALRSITPGNARTSACTLHKKVYGWHPYWMGSAYTGYDFSLLSTFSYFSYEVNPNTGNYNTVRSWKTTNAVQLAQAAGCRVELCATLFGGTNNATFLSNPTAQQTFIDSMIVLVQLRNADGVNIDFEGIPGSQRNNFTAFMQNLSNQLKTAIPGASLTMALYSVDWNNVFDIPALDPYLDEFIIMGYGYYYSGSSLAGPTAPLYSGSIWWSYNLTRSVFYYINEGITRDKLLIGLPYYGNEYQTVDNAVPSSSNAFNGSRTYSYVQNNYLGTYNRIYDYHSETPAWIFQSGSQWQQAWVDDAQSLDKKFDMVYHTNIGGIGMWALGYDGSSTALWDLIEEKFSDCGTPRCADTLFDAGGPLGNYRNNQDESFTLQSPQGQQVRAEFVSFDVELNWDYVYVYDGPSTASPLIGQYTGTTAPGPFLSTGDALTIRFTSDNATVRAGYELRWECEGPVTYPDSIWLNRNDSANLACGTTHRFYDSDAGVAGNYLDNESNTMSFCSPDPAQAVRLSFDMLTPPVQLDLKSTVNGNDYLLVWDGPDTTSPAKAVYTGSTNSYPQPGTIVSSGRCLTVGFRSDASSNGAGWEGTLRCVNPIATGPALLASAAAPLQFEDTGGSAGNYGNNESYAVTYCPTATAASNGEVIHAMFGAVTLEQNYDYLQVYDGPDLQSPLIATFTGNDLNQNDLQTIKASLTNASGCLTFEFYSDGATNYGGWSASIGSGTGRQPFGEDHCSVATLINVGGQPYAGSTTLARGNPNAEDPPLNIELASLPECSGANAITRLENSIWYRFSTPSTICPNSQIDLILENIACQNSIPGGNGAQFTIYESLTCQTGAAWATPVYCSDKLLASFPVNIASLIQPSRTYYIMIDGFAGQHCNLDLMVVGDLNGCLLPIEMVNFSGELVQDVVNLRWDTQAEQNNAGFYVQRGRQSTKGLQFKDIGFVDAAANEQGIGSYTFDDADFQAGQMNYYRLRQLDLDGKSHHHRVIEINAGPDEWQVVLYPNPVGNRSGGEALYLEMKNAPESPGRLALYDLQGKLVETFSWPAHQHQARHEFDVSSLPSGIYLYRLVVGEQIRQGKVVKE